MGGVSSKPPVTGAPAIGPGTVLPKGSARPKSLLRPSLSTMTSQTAAPLASKVISAIPYAIRTTLGSINQDSDPIGEKSCAFQALAFLEKLYEERPAGFNGEFINRCILAGTEKYGLFDQNQHQLYEILQIPVDCFFPGIERKEGEYNYSIQLGAEAQSYLQALNALPNFEGCSASVLTIRNSCYGIAVFGGTAVFYDSHSSQKGMPAQTPANVKVFASKEALAAFLAWNFPAADYSRLTPELRETVCKDLRTRPEFMNVFNLVSFGPVLPPS